jgi:hypothetical protein
MKKRDVQKPAERRKRLVPVEEMEGHAARLIEQAERIKRAAAEVRGLGREGMWIDGASIPSRATKILRGYLRHVVAALAQEREGLL